MKKLFFFLLFFPVYMMAQKTAPGFTIDGKLDGVDDGTKISLYKNGEQTEWISTTLQKGKFTLKEALLFGFPWAALSTEKLCSTTLLNALPVLPLLSLVL
mgnify:CR=1 FL=1